MADRLADRFGEGQVFMDVDTIDDADEAEEGFMDVGGFPADRQPTESVQREGLLDHLVVHTQAGDFVLFTRASSTT